MGGDRMEAAGVSLVYHIRDSAVMGIGEVLSAMPAFLKKQRHLKRLLRKKRPDAVVLVDFAEFNMGACRLRASSANTGRVLYPPKSVGVARISREKDCEKNTRDCLNLSIRNRLLPACGRERTIRRTSVSGLRQLGVKRTRSP